MRNFIGTIFFLVIAVFVNYSCSSDKEGVNEYAESVKEQTEFLGTTSFLQKVHTTIIKPTRTVQAEEQVLSELVEHSSEYLRQNGFDYSEFFEEGDPRIAIVAMSLSKYDRLTSKSVDLRNRATRGVGNCVLEAVGIKGLLDGSIKRLGAKYAAKFIAKKVLSKAVPYLGWGIAAVDFASCMDWI